MPEIAWLIKVLRYLVTAFCWAGFFAIFTVPLGYVAIIGAIVLFSCWALVFLVAKFIKRVPRILDFSYPEFLFVWVVGAIMWYPLWVAGLYLYIHVAAWILGLSR